VPLRGIEKALLAPPHSKPESAPKQIKKPKKRTAALPYVYDHFGVDRRELLESERYPQLTAEAELLRAFINAATIYIEGAKKHLDAGDTTVTVDTWNLHKLTSMGLAIAVRREIALLRDVDKCIEKEARTDGRLPKRGPPKEVRRALDRHVSTPGRPGRKPGALSQAFSKETIIELDRLAEIDFRRLGRRPSDRELVAEFLRYRDGRRPTREAVNAGCTALSRARTKLQIKKRLSKNPPCKS
jgi:hypothetical protein